MKIMIPGEFSYFGVRIVYGQYLCAMYKGAADSHKWVRRYHIGV